jgi:hypothetical protein
MNDILNLNRFSLLLKKTILERPVQIAGLMGFILCFTFILYAAILYTIPFDYRPAQNLSFIWGLVGGGTVLSSFVFGYFNTNASGSSYLTLPASALEKWLCGVLIAGVFFLIIFLGFFRLIDYSFVTAYHNGLDKHSPVYQRLYDQVYIYPFTNNNVVEKILVMWVNFAGAMLVGSLYFNRVAIVKVALVVCGVLGIIYGLNLVLANIFFSNVDVAFPYYNVMIKVKSEVGTVSLPHTAMLVSDTFINYILPITLWLTAFIRLKEKEI